MLISKISKKKIKAEEAVRGSELREGIFNLIKSSIPDFQKEDVISLEELNLFRRLYLTSLITKENGELDQMDRVVINAVNSNTFLSENFQEDPAELTLGAKIADKIALYGGSWKFIFFFLLFLFIWVLINISGLLFTIYDPYPFILLNLILSCIAAIQAPIIMMSQNRVEQKDRERAELDYKINLKAEMEIKLLSDKMDHLIMSQNKRLMEIQEVQADYLDDLIKEIQVMRKKRN